MNAVLHPYAGVRVGDAVRDGWRVLSVVRGPSGRVVVRVGKPCGARDVLSGAPDDQILTTRTVPGGPR